VLGIGNPRRVILEQIDVIGRVVESSFMPDDNTFMDVAGGLLYVEATLQRISLHCRVVAFKICDRPSSRKDYNLHPTLQNADWWFGKLQRYFPIVERHEIAVPSNYLFVCSGNDL